MEVLTGSLTHALRHPYVDHTFRSNHSQNAERVVVIAVGVCDKTTLANIRERRFGTDNDMHTRVFQALIEDTNQAIFLFEGFEKLLHLLEVRGKFRLVHDIGRPPEIDIALALSRIPKGFGAYIEGLLGQFVILRLLLSHTVQDLLAYGPQRLARELLIEVIGNLLQLILGHLSIKDNEFIMYHARFHDKNGQHLSTANLDQLNALEDRNRKDMQHHPSIARDLGQQA